MEEREKKKRGNDGRKKGKKRENEVVEREKKKRGKERREREKRREDKWIYHINIDENHNL